MNDHETQKERGGKKENLPLCISHPRNEMARLVISSRPFPRFTIPPEESRAVSRFTATALLLAFFVSRYVAFHLIRVSLFSPSLSHFPSPSRSLSCSDPRRAQEALAMSPCSLSSSLSSSLPSFLPLWSMLLSRPPCENIPMMPSRLRRMALAKRVGALARLRLGSRGSANSKGSKKVRDSGCAAASDEVAICLCMAGDGRDMGDDGPVAEEGAAGIRISLARCWC